MLEFEELSGRIIGCAMEVHRHLGPGLLESTYRDALDVEFRLRGLTLEREARIPVIYKGHSIGLYRMDFVVERQIVIEVKSVERHIPVFDAQVLSYLRASGCALASS